MKTTSPNSETFNDIVFENRNKQYGAYSIRKYYSDSVTLSFFIAISVVTTIIATPLLLSLLKNANELVSDNSKAKNDDMIYQTHEINLPHEDSNSEKNNPKKNNNANTIPVVTNKKITEDPKTPDPKIGGGSPGIGKDTSSSGGGPGIGPDIGLKKDSITKPELPPASWVAKMPKFPGGDEALVKYLSSHLTYPGEALSRGISGTVYLTFVIDKDGKVADVKSLKSLNGGCTEEAIKVVKSMPAWEPGQNEQGKTVKVQYNLPVTFRLR